MDPRKEKTLGCVLVAGTIIAIVSFVLIWVFGMAGILHGTATREPITNKITDAGDMNLVPLMLVFTVVGVLMVGGALGYGFWYNKNLASGPTTTSSFVKILARYAVDGQGYVLTQDYEIETADRPRFYVRMAFPNTQPSEYECRYETFVCCGEGMTGEVEMQGRWLGKFTPYIGVPQDLPS